MQKCRSLTTPSLIIAFAIGAAALSAQPANASYRFSEAWALGLARLESTLERTWFRLSVDSQRLIQPAEGAVPVPGGKEGAVPVPGGKEGAVPVPGGISSPSLTRPAAPDADRDRSY